MNHINKRDFLKLLLIIPMGILIYEVTKFIKYNKLTWTSINVCDENQQGDAHLISKGNKYFLIDGGKYELASSHLIPYLKSKNIKHLDGVMINHPHSDHYGGIKSLFENNINISKLYMNMPTPAQIAREWWGGTYQDLLDIKILAINNKTDILPIIMGDKFMFDDKSYIEVLYIYDGINTPVGETDINDMSAITMIYDNNNKFLLTGDLNNKLGSYLAKNSINIQADILKVPHHGTEGLAPNSFFDKVKPKDIIVTSPENLWRSKRSSRVRNLATNNNYGTYINGLHGHITIESDESGYSIITEKKAKNIFEGIS